MVKWDKLAKPKEHGGLGFTETRLMDICLMSKLIFKLERDDDDMCYWLLRTKYLKGRYFFSSNHRGASQFWKGLHEAKLYCQRGMNHILGNGSKIRFSGMRFG
jgi:hypothetical protein